MERLKRIAWRILCPPTWLAGIVMLPSFALVIWVLSTGRDDWLAYASYGLSAYALALFIMRVPGVVRAFRTDFQDHPLIARALGSRFSTDAAYRAEVSLHIGLGVNLVYAAIKLVSGIVYQSVWFGALAGYYLLLAILRFALVRRVAGDATAQWRRYRLCGVVLLLMNQALAVVVTLVVRRGSSFEYPGLLVYVMAAYTFYAFTVAIIHFVRAGQQAAPVTAAARAVSLVAALVSMLSLETAMLAQFGTADQAVFRRIVTGATGAAICTAVLAMAIYMIVHSTQQIRKESSNA